MKKSSFVKILSLLMAMVCFSIGTVYTAYADTTDDSDQEPTRGVCSAYTDTYDPYQQETYGYVTVYPAYAQATTYCQYLPAGKQVRAFHRYYGTDNKEHVKDNHVYYDTITSGSSGTFYGSGSNYLTTTTSVPHDVSFSIEAWSHHRVRITSGMGWDNVVCDDVPHAFY